MRAIQVQLPHPKHVETMRIFVTAPPTVAWPAARHFDMSAVPWVRFLFGLRTITDTFHNEKDEVKDKRIGVDQIAENGTGFMIVHEEPGKEVVVASVGQFWHLTIPFATVAPQAFKDFNEEGWGKLAWSITVEPYLSGSTICLELRTTATDDESWNKLKRYYHVIGVFSNMIRHALLANLQTQLGKLPLPDYKTMPLAGDDILPDAHYSDTDHIVIEAPPALVWPYLMQLGCDRAGWYSVDWLDHGGVPSTDHLVPEWTDRKPGDKIAATPKGDSFFEVYRVAPQKHFVAGGEYQMMGEPFKISWAFVLEPVGDDATLLITRAKMVASPKWVEWVMGAVYYPPVHGLMAAVQLKTIKRYAERDALNRVAEKAGKEVKVSQSV